MQRVAVGSTNPAKIDAVRRAFEELFPGDYEAHAVATEGTDAQPWGEARTRQGALARARSALAALTGAGWGIGLEGGMVHDESGILVTSWIAACRRDGRNGMARTAGFYLPEEIAASVRQGAELAEAWRHARGMQRVGRGRGTVGELTGGRITRTRLYAEAVVLAVSLATGR